ncbi:MAG: hypothetical protein EAZ53_01245 [Bacteroidetes bacterium]|nr:MAG: hypothetical protein EAZ53_01245 [Bacteroidota bacterium]
MTTMLTPPYSVYLSDYTDATSNIISGNIIFNDFSEPTWDVRLRIVIESSKIKIENPAEFLPSRSITIVPGVPYTLTALDVAEYLNINNIRVSGISPAEFAQNGGRMPEGFYSFCIEVLDNRTGKVLSNKSCANAILVLKDPPRIITPQCNTYIKPQPSITLPFQWQESNAISPNSRGVEYQLTVEEITDTSNGDVRSAIQNAKTLPILNTPFQQNTFSYLYDAASPPLELGKAYAFRVQAKESSGKDNYKNNGYSEVCWFYYGYPKNRIITPVFPAIAARYRTIEAPVFKWTTPDKFIPGQTFSYKVRVVKKDSAQTAEDAMRDNETWHSEETFSYQTKNLTLKISKKLEPNTQYAWQVTCQSDGQEVAKSPVWWFHGPPVCEVIRAGFHNVFVTSTSNTDLANLSGRGYLLLAGDTAKVEFKNLYVTNEGGIYVLERGRISKKFATPLTLDIAPKQPRNPMMKFYYDELGLTRDNLDLRGHFRYPLPHPVASGQQTYIKSADKWVNYDRMKVACTVPAARGNNFKLIDPYNFKIDIDTTTKFYVFDNAYEVYFFGKVTASDKVTTESKQAVTYPFNFATNLTYISNRFNTASSSILALNNTGLVVQPDSVYIDLDENDSQGGLEPGWKGLWFSNFKLIGRQAMDKAGQLSMYSDFSYPYTQTTSKEVICSINAQGLSLKLSKELSKTDSVRFNTFASLGKKLTINIENNSVSDSKLDGQMLVPFVSTTQQFTYTVPITSEGYMDGYMNDLDAYAFTMNASKGEREVKVKVNRAVFADKNKLAMNISTDWTGLGVQINNQGGFFVWGNNNIGFGEPNGGVTIPNQLQGKVAAYPLVVEGIAAGSSGGNYSLALSGRLNNGEDVSGPNGPPVSNYYSIAPNPYAIKEGQKSIDYTSGQETKASGGDEKTPDDKPAENPGIDQATLDQNAGAITASAEEEKQELVKNSSFKGYATAEIAVDDKKLNALKEKGKDMAMGVASKLSDFALSKLDPVIIPFVDKITKNLTKISDNAIADFNNLMLEISSPASVLLGKKLDSLSNKVNARIDSLVVKGDPKIDGMTATIIDGIKGKVMNLVPEKKKEIRAEIVHIADEMKKEIAAEIKKSLRNSVNTNIKDPLNTYLKEGITQTLDQIIKEEIISAGFDAESNELKANINLNIGKTLERVVTESFNEIDVSKLGSTIAKTGTDAVSGINTEHIFNRFKALLISSSAKVLGELAAKKLLKNTTEKIGVKVPVNMTDLADKLSKGDVKGALLAIDPMEVKMNTAFVSLNGWLKFTPDEPTFGNVFRGDIDVKVKKPKEFHFGAIYINGRKEGSSYWFCEIVGKNKDNVKLGGALTKEVDEMDNPVDIGPVQIAGFKGRMWNHMKETDGSMVPDPSMNRGAYVRMVLLDKSTKGNNVRLDIAGGFQLDAQGEYEVTFKGDGQFVSLGGTVKRKPTSPLVGVEIEVYYNSKEDHLLATLAVEINKSGVICASGTMLFETKPGYWRINVGDEPLEKRISITPLCAGWGGQGWFKIDPNLINVGLAVSFGAKGKLGFDFGIFGVAVKYNVGAALGAKAEFQYNPSFRLNNVGVFVDVWGDLGVCVKALFIFDDCIDLIALRLHGELTIYFYPAPSRIAGKANGHLDVFGGLVSCGFDAEFSVNL